MSDYYQLTPDSTLGDLPCYDFQVSTETPGQVVAEIFSQKPYIPGVIIVNDAGMVGMISRRKFYERMSQPYSIELYMKRPIKVLLDLVKTHPLQISHTCQIYEAARIALDRPEDSVYDPLVIVFKSNKWRLLDMHVLLLGQSQMLSLSNTVIKQQRTEIHTYLVELRKEQKKGKAYTQLLEFNLIEIQKQNQNLRDQKDKVFKQSQEISELNQRFQQICKLLSLEGRKAFQATFAGVNAIYRNTNKIVDIGRAIAKELEALNAASKLISQVSHQVRYLAVQAAMVANRSGGMLSEFSNVTSEIGKMGSQTFEAGRQMDELANRFKFRVQELTESAKEGASVAIALLQKIELAEKAIAELEELATRESCDSTSPTEDPKLDPVETAFMMQKIEPVEGE